jgi:catechol 2,3-dioxygenase-like lactoylglutathione lyase family enzyme
MNPAVVRIRHVKIPVTNVVESAAWYRALLDLELQFEFVEQGALRGVSLVDRAAGYAIALRDREFSASRPDLAGFDYVALAVSSRPALVDLATKCEALEFTHSGVRDNGPFGSNLDVPDPDGTVLRFLWEAPDAPTTFVGIEFDANGKPSTYDKPRFVPDQGVSPKGSARR